MKFYSITVFFSSIYYIYSYSPRILLNSYSIESVNYNKPVTPSNLFGCSTRG